MPTYYVHTMFIIRIYNVGTERNTIMSFIAHYHNKRSGVTYCYRVTSYRDPVTGKPKSHRVLIGKLDESGEMVPTQKRGRPRKADEDAVLGSDIVKALETKEVESLKRELLRLKEERQSFLDQIDSLKAENRSLRKAISSVTNLLKQGTGLLEEASSH